MPNTKHKLFSISLSESSGLHFEEKILNLIDSFLLEANIIYVSHSITVLTAPILKYQKLDGHNHYLILSIVYKDLSETALDVSNVTKKTKEVIKKTIETNEMILMPDIETSFDKKLKQRKNIRKEN